MLRRKGSCGAECPSGEVAGERAREREREREKVIEKEMKTLVNETREWPGVISLPAPHLLTDALLSFPLFSSPPLLSFSRPAHHNMCLLSLFAMEIQS